MLELSESPTTYFSENPDKFKVRFRDAEEAIDWPKYLKETKVALKRNYEESSVSYFLFYE